MKQTRSSRNRKNGKNENRPCPDVCAETVSIFRTVKDHEAFYFYEAIGIPTGDVARNLSDLLDRAKAVKTESLAFHLDRKDFQNWIRKILGDPKLAETLEKIHVSHDDQIRTSISNAVENRTKELSASALAIHVRNNSLMIPARA